MTTPQIIGHAVESAGACFAVSIALVKRNSYINDHMLTVLFWVRQTSTVFSAILIFIFQNPVLPSNWFNTAMVTIHSLSFTGIPPVYIYTSKNVSGNIVALSDNRCRLYSNIPVLSSTGTPELDRGRWSCSYFTRM